MSDICLIPDDPAHVPDEASRAEATAIVQALLPEAEAVQESVEEQVRFIDPGANLERVLCPACGTDLLEEDHWQDLMAGACDTGFLDLAVTVPCCGQRFSLNDLRYDWPSGFARYVLQVTEPGRDLTEHEVQTLGAALGCGLRKIWRE